MCQSQNLAHCGWRALCPGSGGPGCAKHQHLQNLGDRQSCCWGTAKVSTKHMDTHLLWDTALLGDERSLPMENQCWAPCCRTGPFTDTHCPSGSPGDGLVAQQPQEPLGEGEPRKAPMQTKNRRAGARARSRSALGHGEDKLGRRCDSQCRNFFLCTDLHLVSDTIVRTSQ